MATGLGLRIRSRRKELGLSQEALAERLGLKSKSTICKIERGDDNLTTDTVEKYAKALNCVPGYLMGWTDIPSGIDIGKLEVPPEGDGDNSLDRLTLALELYDRYQKAIPEVQAAVETLLTKPKPRS